MSIEIVTIFFFTLKITNLIQKCKNQNIGSNIKEESKNNKLKFKQNNGMWY